MNEQQIITDTQWGERCSVKLDKLLFSTLQKLQIPTIIFINKIDRAGVNLERLYMDIKTNLSQDVLFMQTEWLSIGPTEDMAPKKQHP